MHLKCFVDRLNVQSGKHTSDVFVANSWRAPSSPADILILNHVQWQERLEYECEAITPLTMVAITCGRCSSLCHMRRSIYNSKRTNSQHFRLIFFCNCCSMKIIRTLSCVLYLHTANYFDSYDSPVHLYNLIQCLLRLWPFFVSIALCEQSQIFILYFSSFVKRILFLWLHERRVVAYFFHMNIILIFEAVTHNDDYL